MAHFFGYTNTEIWLSHIRFDAPVYAAPYVETIPTQYAEIKEQIILLAQPDENNDLQYCQLIVGRYKAISGKPFSPQDEKRTSLLGQAWEITKKWLAEEKIEYRQAVAAMPNNRKTMKGEAHYLKYLPEETRWERA